MRQSPSGTDKPIVTTQSPSVPLTLVDAGSVALPRKILNYQIIKGALTVVSTVFLPLDPQDGDEVILANQTTQAGVGSVVLDANGRFIGNFLAASAAFAPGLSAWVKFFAADNVWIVLSDR